MSKQKVKKRNLIKFLSDFFSDVKKEAGKVMWTSKKSLIKYGIATLSFMLFICLFFVGSDLLITLISYIKELVG